MSGCFISYATEDRVLVDHIADRLRHSRHEVWIDRKDIPGGANWESEIQSAIAQADVCLVAVTPDAVQSEWVKREIALARAAGKRVVPILLREVVLPNDLDTLRLADLQVINFVRDGLASGLERLLDVLPEAPLGMPPARTGLRALIVEDEPTQQFAVKQVLALLGFDTTIAWDLDEALSQIRGARFNLITLDMQLHPMDVEGKSGRLLLDELRTYQKGVPVIIISGLKWTGEDVRIFWKKYGVLDFLSKPLDPSELRKTVEEALGKQ